MTPNAKQIELRREYQKWLTMFLQAHTTLSQIVSEDFPDPAAEVTQYHVDAMRDLAQNMNAMVAGYDQR